MHTIALVLFSGCCLVGDIAVVIADDQALVRSGFCALVDIEPGFRVVGEAATGSEAVDVARATRPDVILMDIRMPGIDGIEATRRIVADPSLSSCRVVMLTTFDLDEYVYDALRAGAAGFLLKDVEPLQLLHAIRVVADGDALIAPAITRRLIAEFSARPQSIGADAMLQPLTEREREVLRAIGQGLSNAEIAHTLFMSPLTAKTHVSRILGKLAARDRAQLVVIAYETGLVTPGSGK
jgi:DNA-binding NarL/FixJ family response regulator